MNKVNCPCGIGINYTSCCGSFHSGKSIPKSPEELMRSRYSAYALANIDYINKTMRGKAHEDFDESSTKVWAESVKWLGLEIINSKNESPDCGFVEFIARFMEDGKPRLIHEISEFRHTDGRWYYVDGKHLKTDKKPLALKIGRNNPCPCGSQKKFKNCHGKR